MKKKLKFTQRDFQTMNAKTPVAVRYLPVAPLAKPRVQIRQLAGRKPRRKGKRG